MFAFFFLKKWREKRNCFSRKYKVFACGIFFEEENKKLSKIFVNAIQNSNLQRILWISKEEPRNNILEIDNLTYIKHSSENDYFDTVLSLEEVEEVNEKFIDLK